MQTKQFNTIKKIMYICAQALMSSYFIFFSNIIMQSKKANNVIHS